MPKREVMPAKHQSTADPVSTQNQSTKPSNGFSIHPSIPFIVVLTILLYAGLNAWIYFYGTQIFTFNPFIKKALTTVSIVKEQGFGKIATPSPRLLPETFPAYSLPSGKQEWTFEHGDGVTGPKIQTATVDPLTPKKGEHQTITITVKNDTPVTLARATVFTDGQQNRVDLKLTSGSATDGTWTGGLTMTDTYNIIYHIDFHLESATTRWDGALRFR